VPATTYRRNPCMTASLNPYLGQDSWHDNCVLND